MLLNRRMKMNTFTASAKSDRMYCTIKKDELEI